MLFYAPLPALIAAYAPSQPPQKKLQPPAIRSHKRNKSVQAIPIGLSAKDQAHIPPHKQQQHEASTRPNQKGARGSCAAVAPSQNPARRYGDAGS